MASRFSLSKLFGSKKKEKRPRSSSTPSPSLNLTGDTFTMRLMRPEMRAFHRERVRRESMASSSSDTASLTSALSESAIVTRRPSLGHATRRHSSLDDPKASARSDRRARARFYRAEVTQSVCEEVVDESTSLSSEDQDDLLARVDKMEAELRARRPPLPDTPTIARRSTSSDADSGLDSASVVTACSQSGGVKSDGGGGGGNVGKKGVRFLFPDARIPVQYPGKRDLDLIRSDDEELDTDEEYLGTI